MYFWRILGWWWDRIDVCINRWSRADDRIEWKGRYVGFSLKIRLIIGFMGSGWKDGIDELVDWFSLDGRAFGLARGVTTISRALATITNNPSVHIMNTSQHKASNSVVNFSSIWQIGQKNHQMSCHRWYCRCFFRLGFLSSALVSSSALMTMSRQKSTWDFGFGYW